MNFSNKVMKGSLSCIAAGMLLCGASATSSAHVSVASGPAIAGSSNIVTFSVGHGCEGADTVSLEIELPPEVTSVRVMAAPEFALADIEVVYDDTGAPIMVTYNKNSLLDSDYGYYQLSMRIGTSAAPFSTLYMPALQTCELPDGTVVQTDWAALPGADPLEDGSEPPPAPGLKIVPRTYPGWNKFTAEADITDMSYFADAEIVWAGEAAYSANPTTMDLITAEDGVSVLESIPTGTEFWAKY
jgi:uncharacterized protein YcnI